MVRKLCSKICQNSPKIRNLPNEIFLYLFNIFWTGCPIDLKIGMKNCFLLCNIIIFSYEFGLTVFWGTLSLRALQPYLSILKLIFSNIFVFIVTFSFKIVPKNQTVLPGIGTNEYFEKVIFRHFIDFYTFRLKMLILVKKLLLELCIL